MEGTCFVTSIVADDCIVIGTSIVVVGFIVAVDEP